MCSWRCHKSSAQGLRANPSLDRLRHCPPQQHPHHQRRRGLPPRQVLRRREFLAPAPSYVTVSKLTRQAVRNGIAEAQKVIGSSASEQEKAEARIELEVFEAINAALGKSA